MRLTLPLFLLPGLFTLSASADIVLLADYTDPSQDFRTFGSFEKAVTPGPQGAAISFPSDSQSGTFGGLITDVDTGILATPAILEGDKINITGILGTQSPTSTPTVIFAVRELGENGIRGEFFSFSIPVSEFTEGQVSTVTVALNSSDALFIGDSGMVDGQPNNGNGIVDGFLREVSLQTPFNGNGGLNFTLIQIDADVITPIPEVSSSLLLAMLTLGSVVQHRRR